MSKPNWIALLSIAPVLIGSLFGGNPVVTGPIAAKTAPGDAAHNYPFFAALENLKARGYVEQEYFYSGVANRYQTPDGATGKITDGNHKYQTRLLVRRPADPKKFNGTVIVEWDNVTSGHDLDIDWFQIHDYLIRSGYAWVGVTAQRVGVEALKVWNKDRYGSLDVTADGTIMNDALSYDIFADVGRAARKPNGADFLGGLKAAARDRDGPFAVLRAPGELRQLRSSARSGVRRCDPARWGRKNSYRPEDQNLENQFGNRCDHRAGRGSPAGHREFPDVGSRGRFARRYAVRRQPVEAGGTRRESDRAGIYAGARGEASTRLRRRNWRLVSCDKPTYSDVPFYQVMAAASITWSYG